MRPFIMSVDLGTMSDYTAISIIQESFHRRNDRTPMDFAEGMPGTITLERSYDLRFLEQPKLRTPYEEIVQRVYDLIMSPELKDRVDLVVDATGLGRPVIEMMRSKGLNPIPITITVGQDITEDREGGYHVGKYDLVSALQAWWAMGRLRMSSKIPLMPKLLTELEGFVPKRSSKGHVTYEAIKDSLHDDLVISLAMAVWYAQFSRPWQHKYNMNPGKQPDADYNPFEYLD